MESVKQTEDIVKQKKANYLAWRPTEQEMELISALKQAKSYTQIADVIHLVFNCYLGNNAERDKIKAEILELAQQWRIPPDECPICHGVGSNKNY